MTEVTNKLNIDPSLLTHLVQLTEQMKVDLQQVNSRMNVLEQKVSAFATRAAFSLLPKIFLENFRSQKLN